MSALESLSKTKSANIGRLSALGSLMAYVFSFALLAYSQMRKCNSKGHSYSWMMSSYASNAACGTVTIVALCLLTFGAQILVVVSCFISVLECKARMVVSVTQADASFQLRMGRYSSGFRVHVQQAAYFGIATATVSGFALLTVILFPAYGRSCLAGSLETSPLLAGWHEVAVGFFFIAVGASVTVAGMCLQTVRGFVPLRKRADSFFLRTIIRAQNFFFPYVYVMLFMILVSDALDGTTVPTDTQEGNTGKWEIVFVFLVSIAYFTLAAQLFYSQAFVHMTKE